MGSISRERLWLNGGHQPRRHPLELKVTRRVYTIGALTLAARAASAASHQTMRGLPVRENVSRAPDDSSDMPYDNLGAHVLRMPCWAASPYLLYQPCYRYRAFCSSKHLFCYYETTCTTIRAKRRANLYRQAINIFSTSGAFLRYKSCGVSAV